jgi:hypothetical protein
MSLKTSGLWQQIALLTGSDSRSCMWSTVLDVPVIIPAASVPTRAEESGMKKIVCERKAGKARTDGALEVGDGIGEDAGALEKRLKSSQCKWHRLSSIAVQL